jgi:hypothetical protein
MAVERQPELGKLEMREDPADSGWVLVDFPLSIAADERWMSRFAQRVAASDANAWTVTGESIRLRSRSAPGALRTGIAALRQVVADTNAEDGGAGEDEPLTALQRVVDDEFGEGRGSG